MSCFVKSSDLTGYCQYIVFKVQVDESLLPAFRLSAFLTSGDGEIRTLDPLLARQVLSQLSYTPTKRFPLFCFSPVSSGNGLKWTRTTDLTLIRRAL